MKKIEKLDELINKVENEVQEIRNDYDILIDDIRNDEPGNEIDRDLDAIDRSMRFIDNYTQQITKLVDSMLGGGCDDKVEF